MAEENKALVRRWFEEVWNKGRAGAIDEVFDETASLTACLPFLPVASSRGCEDCSLWGVCVALMQGLNGDMGRGE